MEHEDPVRPELGQRGARETHQAEVANLAAEKDRERDELERSQLVTQAARLRDRLLQLAGYGAPRAEAGPQDGQS